MRTLLPPLAALLLAGPTFSAPAPLPRPVRKAVLKEPWSPPAPALLGTWRLTWQSDFAGMVRSGPAFFGPDGRLEYLYGGSLYTGRFRYCSRTGLLEVWDQLGEEPPRDTGGDCYWKATLSRDLLNRTTGETAQYGRIYLEALRD